ncbi:MAG TPA: carboxypeptidase regulatory-like domain-containing protein [Candidatus Acidoferrales bacterium]|nr:carboxypeptidase regulatory-like domain-containing protein [Candidatus Acidoferrales bacterium]
MRVWKNVSGILAILALCCIPLAARQTQEPPSHVTLQGIVRTGDNVPVPGASVHIMEQISGKSWITWTDEQGKFRLPELPAGKFRIEATQIGFAMATVELTPTEEKGPDIILSLPVASLNEITAANASAATPPASTTPTNTPPNAETKTQTANAPPPPVAGAQTGTSTNPGTTPTTNARGGRGNQPGQRQQGGRGNAGGFSQVDVTGQGSAGADNTDLTGGAGDPLGGTQAATADAIVASGTVAQGFSGGGFNMQFGGGPEGNNPNAQAGQTGILNAGNGELPGGGFPGGNPGGGGGRGPGGPPGGGGGGRGPGGGGGGGRGGRGGAQGANGPPWGLNNVIRRRINSMHYTLNETLYDSAFDARPWYATTLPISSTNQPPAKVAFNNNRFGGSLGGPFRIPKLYDGRDKTYFFINAQFGHGTNGVNNYSNVPTADERLGNFCSSGTNGVPLVLYDFTTNFTGPRTVLPNLPAGSCNLQGATNPHTGLPYLSPTATALLGFVPMPNLPAGGQYNYLLQTSTPTNTQAINMRVNQTISPKLNLGVTYNLSQSQSSGQGSFPTETSTSSSRGQNVTLTLNHNISTRLINTIALNFTRQRTVSLNGFANVTDVEGSLGITGVDNSNPLNWGLPGVSFSTSNGLPYTGFNDPVPSLRKNETWNLSDTVSYTLPKHTLHFGFTFRRVQLNNVFDPNPRGSFNFNGLMSENFSLVNGVDQPAANTGSPLADFEMGLPAGTNIRFGDSFNYLRTHGFIAYANDDWHILPRLTLTFGLRYELMYPPSELFGHIANLDVSPTFNNAVVVVPCTSGITPCGTGAFSGSLPNSLINTNYLNFAPRFAFAWRVPGNWFDANNGRHALVVRAGYSVVDITSTYNGLDSSLLNQSPFATVTSPATSLTQVLTLQNGFPASAGTNFNTIAVNPNYKNPYTQIWNFSLESQIVDGMTWGLYYVGTKGTHLDLFTAPNVLSANSLALQRLPIPQNLAFTYDTSGANSEYNGMQARLQKRMRNGFTFTALYTFSKSIDDSSSIGGSSGTLVQQFPFFNLERGLSTFDARHSITGNSTFELPFGQRKHWARTGLEARLFGNFRLSGSTTFHTGNPLTPIVQGLLTQYASGNFQTRPDVLAGCNGNLSYGQQTVGNFINTSCFAAPGNVFPTPACLAASANCITAPGNLFGNAGRDTITGPSMFVVNMALQRTITLDRDGQKHLDLRWEVNNLANHPNWAGLALVVGARNFGEITSAGSMRTMNAVIRLNF